MLYYEAFLDKQGDGLVTFHTPKMSLRFLKKEDLLACRGEFASILQETYEALLKRMPITAWKNNACATPWLQKPSDVTNRSTYIEHVFENVQVLKGLTAAELVRKMDKDYGEALGWNCTNCHRFAPQGNFASDTSNDKRRARFMQQMQNDINLVTLPKLYPKDTPKVTCATCHRGYNEPPAGEYLLPERGKPGGLPPLPQRGATPPAAKPPER